MSSLNWDYEHAYPGGPMVAVLGFPRPLYPPDSTAYKPSVNGPDVEAYKRTISRLGRWKWQAFDQAFSNAFSHGKSGNVGESGVEGFQRQMKIDATGNIGQVTFNALRSAKVPKGLPNAGQYGMDARSVELINAAWNRFGGKEPSDGGSTTKAQARLKKAVAEIGYREGGGNSNKYGQWYGMNNQPWCAMFITWCDLLGPSPTTATFVKGYRYSYVPYMVNDARLAINGLSIVSTPKPGDLVCYDWGRDGEYDHVGIFESGNSSNWSAIEGNTSTSNNSNGGSVMRRTRSSSGINRVFIRVRE